MISTLLPILPKKVLRFLTRLIILYIAQQYVLRGGVETCASALYTPPHTELCEALHAEVNHVFHATYMRSMCYLFLVYI